VPALRRAVSGTTWAGGGPAHPPLSHFGSGVSTSFTCPFLRRFTTGSSRHRRTQGWSVSRFWLAEAELLSASFRPNDLPSRYPCCVALTLLSKRNFFEVISCAVKGRTPLRTTHATFTARRSSLTHAPERARSSDPDDSSAQGPYLLPGLRTPVAQGDPL
jgi:hypothetical protein